METGELWLTPAGREALANASASGSSVKPKYFKLSKQDLDIEDESLTDASINWWIQKDIASYAKINDNIVEFVLIVEPDEAIDFAVVMGLFLKDGTMFALAKQPYGGLIPTTRQILKPQLRYLNASNGLLDFQYIPFDVQEQYASILDSQLTYFMLALDNTQKMEMIERLFKSILHGNPNKTFKASKAVESSDVVTLGQVKEMHNKLVSSSFNLPNGDIKTQIFTGSLSTTNNYFGYINKKSVGALEFIKISLTVELANTVDLPNDDEWYVQVPYSVLGVSRDKLLESNAMFQFYRDGADTISNVCSIEFKNDYIQFWKEETMGGANSTDLDKLTITANLTHFKGA